MNGSRILSGGLALTVLASSPALAQSMDHSGHAMEMTDPAEKHPAEQGPHAGHAGNTMDHSGHAMDMSAPTPASQGTADPHAGHAMDHSGHDGMAMPVPAAPDPNTPTVETPPPPDAGFGPARAADAIWGAEAMQASRAALGPSMGAQVLSKVLVDRLEYRARQNGNGYLWDASAWLGGDIDKLWLRSEGEGTFGEKPESAEVRALWSHAIGPWFDIQSGVQQDLTGPRHSYATIGVQGLAPYQFEVNAAAFLSTKGDFTARVEGELDQRITQRLILQPRAELRFSAQDVPELGVGSGLDTVELELRLRYHFVREFAPYLGIAQEWKIGGSADYARAAGDNVKSTNLVIGVRAWF